MYLPDTHTILWFLHNSPQLSKKALNIITNYNNGKTALCQYSIFMGNCN